MSNCILCEYYSSTGYYCEIVEKDKFDITQMDKRWEELFFFPINQDSEGSWEYTDCEVEPFFEISIRDFIWNWAIGRKLWFNDSYKMLYSGYGKSEDFEEALNDALDAFNNMDAIPPMTELEDIDDDFTKIKS